MNDRIKNNMYKSILSTVGSVHCRGIQSLTFLKYILPLWIICAITPVHGQDDVVKVAVMDLKARTGIDNMTVSSITDFVCTTILNIGGYEVIGKDDMQTMMEHIADRQLLDCDDTKCLAKIGGALGVQLLVSGNIGMVGKMYLINVKLIDIEDATVKNRVSEKYIGDETGLVGKVEETIGMLLSVDGGSMQTVAVPATEILEQPIAETPTAPPLGTTSNEQEKRTLSYTFLVGVTGGQVVEDEAYYEEMYDEYQHRALSGVYGAVRVYVPVTKALSLIIEPAYTQKNYREYTRSDSSDTYVELNTKYYLDYLTMLAAPALQFGPLYIMGGVSFGLLFDAWSETEEAKLIGGTVIKRNYDGDENDIRSDGDMSIVLGGGYHKGLWCVDMRMTVGLTNISTDPLESPLNNFAQDISTILLQFTAGFNF